MRTSTFNRSGLLHLLKAKMWWFNSRKEFEKSSYQTDIDVKVMCENEED